MTVRKEVSILEIETDAELFEGAIVYDPIKSIIYRILSLSDDAKTAEVESKDLVYRHFSVIDWRLPEAWDRVDEFQGVK